MRRALYIAAVLCLGIALVHLWELPGHAQDRPVQGAFLLLAGALQGLYGLVLLRWPTRSVVVLGVGTNLVVLAFHVLIQLLDSYKGLHGAGVGVLVILGTTLALALLSGTLVGSRRMLHAAQLLSLAAALMHLSQVAERVGEWWGFGAFFLVVGTAQLLYCLALPAFYGRLSFLWAGAAGSLSVVALWFFTRTVGVPYLRTTGIQSTELRAGMVERVGPADLTATLAEVALISLLGLMLAGRYRLRLPAGERRYAGRSLPAEHAESEEPVPRL